MRAALKLLTVIILLCAAPFAAQTAHAQSEVGSSSGDELLRQGEAALAKSQFKVAIQQFTKALRAGDLEEIGVAKALYQRGVAQEREGKPAQAIADITSALYLPSLPAADRAKAYLSRGRAFENVGMADLARADISRARSGGVSSQQIANSAAPAAQSEGSSGGSGFTTRIGRPGATTPAFETSSRDSARAPAPALSTSSRTASSANSAFSTSSAPPRQRTASFETSSSGGSQGSESIPRFRTTIAPSDNQPAPSSPQRTAARSGASSGSSWSTSTSASTPAPQPAQEETGSGVGRFFGNLWNNATGGDDKNETAAPVPAPAPAAQPAPSWSQTTRTARAPEQPQAPQAATPPPSNGFSTSSRSASTGFATASRAPAATAQPARPVAAPAPASGGSGYRIQLAALKSDAEAQATWRRLQAKHPSFLGSRTPNIVRTELGGLGTFYRVQLGPFADKASSQQLCKDFKAGGLDCFLLAP